MRSIPTEMKILAQAVVLMLLLSPTAFANVEDLAEPNNLPDRIEDLEIPVLPFERNVAFASWILELDEEEIVDWLTQSTKASWNVKPRTRKDLQSLLLSRLVALDPAQALEFVLQRREPNRSTMMTLVFREWAQIDLNGAIGQAKSLPVRDSQEILHTVFKSNEEFSPDALHTIGREFAIYTNRPERPPGFRVLVDNGIRPASTQIDSLIRNSIENPAKVWYDIVEHARPNAIHYQDLTDVAAAWANESGVGVLDAIQESLTDYGIRKSVIGLTLLKLMQTMPEEALGYAASHKIPGRTETIKSMVRKWADVDPVATLNKVHSMPSSAFRRLLEQVVLEIWLPKFSLTGYYREEPSSILESLHLIPGELRGVASAHAIEVMVWRGSPLEAVEALLRLDEQSKLVATRALMKEWLQKDHQSAIVWARTNPEIEDIRTEVLQTLVWSLDPKSPIAFDIARELPTPDHGFGLEGEFIVSIAPRYLDTAMDLLPRVREGKTKLKAYLSVGTQLLQHGRTSEALDLGAQLPGKYAWQATYYHRVATTWAQTDTQGLVDSMDQFPMLVRPSIAAQQLHTNRSTNHLSQRQVQSLRSYLTADYQDLLDEN